ncbi:MAG: RNB domain-containing ribonuclease [Anaerolineae bacterium]|jgi:exoribonuclease-2
MANTMPHQDSLVLYKTRPARVAHLRAKRLEIELAEGESLRVRPKDILLLHPGPLSSLAALQPQKGEIHAAWELLAGQTTTLAELAELAYGQFTPSTAWAAWLHVADGLYFQGTPQEISARSRAEVVEEQAVRQARAAEEQAWTELINLLREGRLGTGEGQVPPGRYAEFFREVEDLAYGRIDKSRLLRELGRGESPENAHALLLQLGIWSPAINPYPTRQHVTTSIPELAVPSLSAEDRRDLTHLLAFAIDDEGNQEPDDALSLEDDRLWVHIADVAALAPPGSSLDLEARERGAALYLPERTVPMIPFAAIEGLGLGLSEISPALSFGLDLTREGQLAGMEIVPSWVRVTRLTYREAQARLEQEPLASLYRWAQIYGARRQAAGAVSLEFPEVDIAVEGEQIVIRPILPLQSRDLVTEAMLMTGEAVARYALQHGISMPFTTQDPPRSDERPTDLSGMFALRRSLQPSQYSTIAAPHAGLGMEVYTQATSPLRRYLDLVAHQQLRAHVRGEELLDSAQIIERVGTTEAVSGSVRRAERLSRRHWTLVYLLQRPGWTGEGIVVERRGQRTTLIIPELDLDARLRVRRDLSLNSTVSIALRQVDLPRLAAHFRLSG